MDARERLKAYLRKKKITQTTFAESIGASVTYVNALRRGFGSYEGKVRELYPDLNIGWVITGDGEMFNGAQPAAAKTQTIIGDRDMVMIPSDVWEVVRNQAASLKAKDEQMDKMLSLLSEKISTSNETPTSVEKSHKDAESPPLGKFVRRGDMCK